MIDAMSKGETFEFQFPKYQHIFKDTYGLFAYQEQLMALAGQMSGFDSIKQDTLRKSTGKKDEVLLNSLKEDFINGAIANGESKKELETFWEQMLGFARYAFNKSHKKIKSVTCKIVDRPMFECNNTCINKEYRGYDFNLG